MHSKGRGEEEEPPLTLLPGSVRDADPRGALLSEAASTFHRLNGLSTSPTRTRSPGATRQTSEGGEKKLCGLCVKHKINVVGTRTRWRGRGMQPIISE